MAAVPDAGLRAEGEGRWADAVEIYKAALKRDPKQVELWERIADIRATKLNSPARAAEALREAVSLTPDDARLHHKLAQAYSAADDPAQAFDAIQRALEIEPKNVVFLRMPGELAVWLGDHAVATDSYERLLALAPHDGDAELALARVMAWRGNTDEAARRYAAYLDTHPQARMATLEFARVMTERGDYARAMEILEDYRGRFGEDADYTRQEARILAWAQRPRAAIAIVEPLLHANSRDYDLNYTHTLALNADQQPREALFSLGALRELGPDRQETRDIERFVRTPQRSFVTASYAYRTDSDHVTIQPLRFEGAYRLNPETALLAGVGYASLSAPVGSGLEHKNGGSGAHYVREWVGVQHVYSPIWAVEGRLGAGQASGAGSHNLYELMFVTRPTDELRLRFGGRQDIHDVSPRAVSLGIERRGTQMDAQWTPDLRYTIVGMASTDRFSDGNDRWEWVLAPRRAVVRNQSLNLDIGVSAQQYGFDHNPGHGYYAPHLYQRYAVTAFGYWKILDDIGISTTLSLGPYKDNTMGGFRNGGDLVVEGFFGIYRDWYLNVRAGLSHYGGGFSRAYESRAFHIALTRRF